MATQATTASRDFAKYAGELNTLLWAKLMGQLTTEQRDILLTLQKLRSLHDAIRTDDPYNRPETNLSHEHLLAEVQHGELLLTGCDWKKIHQEDRARTDAAIARACAGPKVPANGKRPEPVAGD